MEHEDIHVEAVEHTIRCIEQNYTMTYDDMVSDLSWYWASGKAQEWMLEWIKCLVE